jgi:hypothetical protein
MLLAVFAEALVAFGLQSAVDHGADGRGLVAQNLHFRFVFDIHNVTFFRVIILKHEKRCDARRNAAFFKKSEIAPHKIKSHPARGNAAFLS